VICQTGPLESLLRLPMPLGLFRNFRNGPPKKSDRYNIAVVQFKRRTFGVGQEEELHWALIAYPKDDLTQSSRKVWQAINSVVPGDNGGKVQWTLRGNDVEVTQSSNACLGGVIIGQISETDLLELDKVPQQMMKNAEIHLLI
jgi:hypothetical protein